MAKSLAGVRVDLQNAGGPDVAGHGLARVLSKMGVCSRSQALNYIREGRVRLDGQLIVDPEWRVTRRNPRITLDGQPVAAVEKVYIAFNKPRGLVVTAADERGRSTVYSTLAHANLPWLGVVGRLDKASEGLLLLSNDTVWAAGITNPAAHQIKTYHVQVTGCPGDDVCAAMLQGVDEGGERLAALRVVPLRAGEKNAWLEISLDEGRNRQIRRMLSALGYEVRRLVRISIGNVALGDLAKGQWRHLAAAEVAELSVKNGRPHGR